MQIFRFELNGRDLSRFDVGARSFPAFSGTGPYRNKRAHACLKGSGPIPPGSYFVVDRQGGGLLGSMRDLISDKSEWFALYCDDGKVDDETFCDRVARGNFRLHPKGPLGISEGCITVESRSDFRQARAMILANPMAKIPGSELKAYGKVLVR